MKGIILAGGVGSRLWPLTAAVSKQLLPVYNKPMLYYPLGTLMLAGIREILLISTSSDLPLYKKLLGNGQKFGISLEYAVQKAPEGLAQAFVIGEKFIKDERSCLILGDNIFHGTGLGSQLAGLQNVDGAHIFGYRVKNSNEYGIAELNEDGSISRLVEKPLDTNSNIAVPGLYFYDEQVSEFVKQMKKSARGEYEITDLNSRYLEEGKLRITMLERGTAWLDTGTFEGLYAANSYIRVVEERQGQMVGCLEEIAWRKGWISTEELLSSAEKLEINSYGRYLKSLTE